MKETDIAIPFTVENVKEYLDDGKKLFKIIGDDLNQISEKFIRLNKSYRDEESFKEICIALGLLSNLLDLNIE